MKTEYEREITNIELEAADIILRRHVNHLDDVHDITKGLSEATVEFMEQSPWTYCLLRIDGQIIPGVAKRCTYSKCQDAPDFNVGERVAFVRAIYHLIELSGLEQC
jgi:hypothetical protein